MFAAVLKPASGTLLGIAALVAACALASLPARANDSSALLGAGGIVLTRNAHVRMESEVLTISTHRVRVEYIFRNTGKATVSTRVAFPLPLIPACVGLRAVACDGDIQADAGGDPVHFHLWIDGKPMSFATEEKPAKDAEGEPARAITHHWRQSFPPGRTVRVVHEYVPVAGFGYTLLDPGSAPDVDAADFARALETDYCVDSGTKADFRAVQHGITEVHYILVTGANWNGPIARFTLRVDVDEPGGRVATCMKGLRRVSPTRVAVSRTDFTPRTDLKLLFTSSHARSLEALERRRVDEVRAR